MTADHLLKEGKNIFLFHINILMVFFSGQVMNKFPDISMIFPYLFMRLSIQRYVTLPIWVNIGYHKMRQILYYIDKYQQFFAGFQICPVNEYT